MSNTELLPCPMCGGQAELLTDNSLWLVVCENCCVGTDAQYRKDQAAAIWNRRTPTEPTLDEMILAISERKLPFVLQGWGRTWWVDYWDNRTVDQDTPSAAIRAAWEAVCKEEA